MKRRALKLVAAPGLEAEARAALEHLRRAGTASELVPRGDDGEPSERALEAILKGRADIGFSDRRPFHRTVEPVAVLRREEARDVIVGPADGQGTLAGLPKGARIALSGTRRLGLLKAHRPDLHPVMVTNGHKPLSALDSGAADAVILGAAESRRLGLAERTTEFLDPRCWLPAPGQGAVLVLARAGDEAARTAAAELNDLFSELAWKCETGLADALGAEPDAPLGALAMVFGHWIRLWAMVTSLDGSRVVRGDLTGSMDDPAGLAGAVAHLLSRRDGSRIMAGSDQ